MCREMTLLTVEEGEDGARCGWEEASQKTDRKPRLDGLQEALS